MNSIQSERGWKRYFYCGIANEQDRRNQYIFAAWCLAWAASFTVASALLSETPAVSKPLFALLVAVPTLLGFGALLAYRRVLRQTDELLRKIQTDATAIALGAFLLIAMSHSLLESAGKPPLQAIDLFTPVIVIWSAAQIFGMWRYR